MMSLSKKIFLGFLVVLMGVTTLFLLEYFRPYRRKIRYHEQGNKYAQQHRYRLAIRQFESALAIDPQDVAIRTDLALAYKSKKDFDSAIYHLRMVIQNSDDQEVYITLINAYLAKRQYKDALQVCNAYLRDRPHDLTMLCEKGIVLWRLGYIKAAEDTLHAAIKKNPDNLQPCLYLAQIYQHTQRTFDSILLLKGYLKKYPAHFSLRFQLGKAYLAAKQYENAIEEFSWLYEKHPRLLAQIAPHFVEALLNGRKISRAIAVAKSVLGNSWRRLGRHPILIYARGLAHLRNGNYEQAIQDFEWAGEKYQTMPEILYQLARVYVKHHKKLLAISTLKKLALQHPNFLQGRLLLIDLLTEERQLDIAMLHCDQLLRYYPTELEVLRTKTRVLSAAGKFAEAERVCELFPNSLEKNLQKAKLITQQKRHHEASKLLKHLLKEHPRHQVLVYLLAKNYFALKNIERALHYGYRCLDIDPNMDDAQRLLVQIYISQRAFAQAAAIYEADLKNGDDFSKRLKLANLYLKMERPLQALEVVTNIDGDNLKNPDYLQCRADICIALRQTREALRYLRRIPHPSMHVHTLAGDLYHLLGDYPSTISNYRLAQLKAGDKSVFDRIAIAHYFQRDWEKTQAALTRHLQFGEDYLAHILLTIIFALKNQREQAFLSTQTLLAQHPQYRWLTHCVRGAIYVNFHQFVRGQKEIEQVVGPPILKKELGQLFVKQRFVNVFPLLVAIIFERMERLSSALRQCEEALLFLPDSSSALYTKARILQKLQRRKEACAILRLLASKKHCHPLIYEFLGKLLFEENSFEQAIAYLGKIPPGKKNTDVLCVLGMCYQQLQKYEQARSYYRRVVENSKLQPKTTYEVRAYYRLAQLLYTSQSQRAAKYAHIAFEKKPYDCEVVATLGLAYFHGRKYQQALRFLSYANNLQPHDFTILYRLGTVLLKLQKYSAAGSKLEKARSLAPASDIQAIKDLLQIIHQQTG